VWRTIKKVKENASLAAQCLEPPCQGLLLLGHQQGLQRHEQGTARHDRAHGQLRHGGAVPTAII
jgi:hypothetical protein